MSSDGSARVVVTALGANLGVAAAKFVAARLGPDELLVAGKIAVPSDADGADIATTIDDAEARVREALPSARIIYLEPDIYRPETTARS